MNNQLELSNGLQQCFGISFTKLNQPVSNSIQIDEDLYKTIEQTLHNEFGDNSIALKMSIDADKYRKYYDGTYSSMVNDSVSKIKHEGFEGVDLINLAKNIYDGVNKNIAQNVLQIYNQNLLKIFEDVNNFQQEMIDVIIAEHIAEIESYKMFYEDLQEDISDIMISPVRRMSYLNKIINNKTEIYKNFVFLLDRLKHFADTTNSCYQWTPTENELRNSLLKVSFLIKLNMNNCIYEYVLAGDYTKSPKEKIMIRCRNMEKKLISTLALLRQKYNNIFSNLNGWLYGFFSNGFLVTDGLNKFDENTLLLDYSELDNLQKNIKNNLENVTLIKK